MRLRAHASGNASNGHHIMKIYRKLHLYRRKASLIKNRKTYPIVQQNNYQLQEDVIEMLAQEAFERQDYYHLAYSNY